MAPVRLCVRAWLVPWAAARQPACAVPPSQPAWFKLEAGAVWASQLGLGPSARVQTPLPGSRRMAQDMADANEHAEPAAAVVVEGGAAKSHGPRRERGPRRDRPPRSEQQQRDQPLPEYDESKLIKAKSGKVVQPAKPDPTERDVALEKLSGEVKRLGDRIAAIKEQKAAAQRKGAKRSSVPLPPEAAQHRQARQALQEQWNAELVRAAAAATRGMPCTCATCCQPLSTWGGRNGRSRRL